MAVDRIRGMNMNAGTSVMVARGSDGKIAGLVVYNNGEKDIPPSKSLEIVFLASTGKVRHTGTELFSKVVQENPGLAVQIHADGGAKTFYEKLGMTIVQGKSEGSGDAVYEWSAEKAAKFASHPREVINKALAELEYNCGTGSGGFQPGNTCAREGGGGGETANPEQAARVERAKKSYNPVTKEKKRIATENELKVAAAVKGEHTRDNAPFDVLLPNGHALEVKTIMVGAKNDKVTVHPSSMEKKMSFADQFGYKPHMVVFDQRDGSIYYKKEVGSYRLNNMTKLTLADLTKVLK